MIKQTIIGSIVLTLILMTASVELKSDPLKIVVIEPKNEDQNEIIFELSKKYFVDLINDPTRELTIVAALVDVVNDKEFLEALKQKKIKYKLEESDSLVDKIEKQRRRATSRDVDVPFDYNRFHTLEEIYQELDNLFIGNPNTVNVEGIGYTYENRSIKAITIRATAPNAKIVVIECGIHAREWLSHTFCMWVIKKLRSDTRLLENYEFVIIPVLNPDGYVYTWKGVPPNGVIPNGNDDPNWGQYIASRYWRTNRKVLRYPEDWMGMEEGDRIWVYNYKKNRSQLHECMGIDPNRNFPTQHFCAPFTRGSYCPCRPGYCGGEPGNAEETAALVAFLTPKKGLIVAYFSLHTFAQKWMYPYSYTNASAPNANELNRLAKRATEALFQVDATNYTYGQIYSHIYPTSGDSLAWVYDTLEVKYAFIAEMRPGPIPSGWGGTGRSFFLRDETEIHINGREVFTGIEAILDEIAANSNIVPGVEALGGGGLSTQMMASVITVFVVIISALIIRFL